MYLYLARHAWAGNYGDPAWPDDSERPLTNEGIVRYRRMLDRLVKSGVTPQVIATSPYVRCRQTAELMADVCGGEIVERDELAVGAELSKLIHWSNAQRVGEMAWVGHNPDMGLMAAALVGDAASSIRFAKGTVASIRFRGKVEVGAGELYWLATAKLLGV